MVNTELMKVIHFQKILMLITAMWPRRNSSILYKLRANTVYLCVLTSIIAMLIELTQTLDNYDKLTSSLSLFIPPTVYMLKQIVFTYKKQSFLKILDLIKHPIYTEYPETLDHLMTRAIRKSNFVSVLFQSSCAGVILCYSFKPFMTENYELPFSMSFVDFGVWKYPVHFWQSCSLLFAAWNNSCMDLVVVGFMIAGAAHFEIIQARILMARDAGVLLQGGITAGENDVSGEIDREVNRKLGRIVEHHIMIIEFLNLVEETFTYGFLMQFINSIFVICNIGFQLAHATPNSIQFVIMTLFFAAMMIQLALYCWFGNELMLNSLSILNACYLCNWTSCGPSVRRSLFIIMERTKRPFYLTAGKFAYISLQSFTSILQSSYSYFALMQRLYNEDLENQIEN